MNTTPKSETPSPHPLNRPLPTRQAGGVQHLLVALLFGQSLFLMLLAGQILYRGLREAWIIGRMPSVYAGDPDFPFHRVVLLSVLPFGFNLVFGFVFGQTFYRRARPSEDSQALTPLAIVRRVVLNPGLLRAAGWWVLFLLPLFLTAPPSPRAIIYPFAWTPKSLILPLRIELGLFFPMGTLGLWAGFSMALLNESARATFAGKGKCQSTGPEIRKGSLSNEAPF